MAPQPGERLSVKLEILHKNDSLYFPDAYIRILQLTPNTKRRSGGRNCDGGPDVLVGDVSVLPLNLQASIISHAM